MLVDGETCRVRDTGQTGDSYAYLADNLGAHGAEATEAGGTGDQLTAITTPIGNLDWTARAILSGTVDTVTSNADFTLTSDDLSATDDQYKKCWLVFVTGNNKAVGRMIGVYTGATKRVQFNGAGVRGVFPSTVVAGDEWYLIPTSDVVAGIVGVRAS